MKKQFDTKKLVLLNLPYLLMGLFATNFGEAWRLAQGANASEKFLSLFAVLPGALQSFWPSLHPLDLLVGLCCGAGLRLAVYLKSKNAKTSVLMNIIPAKVAGVDRICMVTPPGKDGKVNPGTLVAANEAGVDVIYKVGGAQAIAALAFGTESIPKVDKIVGPGNIYVALAKKAEGASNGHRS